MNFIAHYHRFSDIIVKYEVDLRRDYEELTGVISSISDQDLIDEFEETKRTRATTKSISEPINKLLDSRLVPLGWIRQAQLFREAPYTAANIKAWRLDFAKRDTISVEVAFNHGEAIAHNLMKPVLASELNHVEKEVQTRLGVIITCTEDLKTIGGFDGAVGTYEKFISYLKPYNTLVTTPVVLIGLKPPRTFIIEDKNIVAI